MGSEEVQGRDVSLSSSVQKVFEQGAAKASPEF